MPPSVALMWVFTNFAEGLEAVLAPPNQQATDVGGHHQPPSTIRRRGSHDPYRAQSDSMLVGHRAFTAFASLVNKLPAAAEQDGDHETIQTRSDAQQPHGAPSGAASFKVTTTDPSNPVLVGVCGENIDLGTPLSWEEDHCFVVECSARGAFLWSDRGSKWGQRLSEKCFEQLSATASATAAPTVDETTAAAATSGTLSVTGGSPTAMPSAGLYEAQVDVRWTPTHVTMSMPLYGDVATFERPAVADIQGRTTECDTPPNLAPCTTFFASEAEVTVY
jgi:hypothetical protein